MRDLYHNLQLVQLLDVQDLAHADTASQYVDLAGIGGAGIGVVVGALTGVDASNTLIMFSVSGKY